MGCPDPQEAASVKDSQTEGRSAAVAKNKGWNAD